MLMTLYSSMMDEIVASLDAASAAEGSDGPPVGEFLTSQQVRVHGVKV